MISLESKHILDFDKNNFEAVIFDLDGTMIDNMMIHHHAWQHKLKELGMDLPLAEVMQKVHGINEEILQRLFGNQLSQEERKFHAYDKEALYRKKAIDTLKLIDGLEAFLSKVKSKGIRLAIGSAAPPENVDFALDNLGIRPFFEIIRHSDHVSKGKPDPEIYSSIMRDMDLSPDSCLIFEDSVVGAQAGVSAGADVVVITTTHEEHEFSHLPIKAFIKDYNIDNPQTP